MDPFWKTFFEDFKDRGRDATPFLMTLVALVCLLILAGIADSCGLFDNLASTLAWVGTIGGIAVVLWTVAAIRRARNHRRERWERLALSCDEWRVARSKLKSRSDSFKLLKPVERPPDTDLKM